MKKLQQILNFKTIVAKIGFNKPVLASLSGMQKAINSQMAIKKTINNTAPINKGSYDGSN